MLFVSRAGPAPLPVPVYSSSQVSDRKIRNLSGIRAWVKAHIEAAIRVARRRRKNTIQLSANAYEENGDVADCRAAGFAYNIVVLKERRAAEFNRRVRRVRRKRWKRWVGRMLSSEWAREERKTIA